MSLQGETRGGEAKRLQWRARGTENVPFRVFVGSALSRFPVDAVAFPRWMSTRRPPSVRPTVFLCCYGLTFFIWALYDAMFVVFANMDLSPRTPSGLSCRSRRLDASSSRSEDTSPLVQRRGVSPLQIYRACCFIGLIYLLLVPSLNPILKSAASLCRRKIVDSSRHVCFSSADRRSRGETPWPGPPPLLICTTSYGSI